MSCAKLTRYTVDPVSGNVTLSGGPDGTVTIVPSNASWAGNILTLWGGALPAPLVVDLSGFATVAQLDDYLQTVVHDGTLVGNGTTGSPLGVAPGTYVTPAELATALAPYLTAAAHDATLQNVYANDGTTVLFRAHN